MNFNPSCEHITSNQRFFADKGWVQTFHTFAFDGSSHLQRKHFGALKILNDDTLAPNTHFPPHNHKNMEILSIVLDGALEHKDSLGNSSVLTTGSTQLISSGSGISHSERNVHPGKTTRNLQIWLYPNKDNLPPTHQVGRLKFDKKDNLVASPNGINNSLKINQNVFIHILNLKKNFRIRIKPTYKYFLQVISGNLIIDGMIVQKGDSLSIENTNSILDLKCTENTTILIFKLK